MKWYLKALAQNAFDAMPAVVAQPVYYQLQRRFGELRHPRYRMRFDGAMEVAAALRERGDQVTGKRFLEVGTGRTVDLPMALWLMGAEQTITVDIARLLRAELLPGALDHLRRHWSEYRERFAEFAALDMVEARFEKLERLSRDGTDEDRLPRLLQALSIDYRAPQDATRLDLGEGAVDVVVTFVVLQHVPSQSMEEILAATRDMLMPSGAMVHVVNTSDHFSHADQSLSPLHFLRWSEPQWDRIAGNQFMYQNRMRADDYYETFSRLGLRVTRIDEQIDHQALRDLRKGLPLHPDWRGREPERDAVIRFTVLLEPNDTEAWPSQVWRRRAKGGPGPSPR